MIDRTKENAMTGRSSRLDEESGIAETVFGSVLEAEAEGDRRAWTAAAATETAASKRAAMSAEVAVRRMPSGVRRHDARGRDTGRRGGVDDLWLLHDDRLLDDHGLGLLDHHLRRLLLLDDLGLLHHLRLLGGLLLVDHRGLLLIHDCRGLLVNDGGRLLVDKRGGLLHQNGAGLRRADGCGGVLLLARPCDDVVDHLGGEQSGQNLAGRGPFAVAGAGRTWCRHEQSKRCCQD